MAYKMKKPRKANTMGALISQLIAVEAMINREATKVPYWYGQEDGSIKLVYEDGEEIGTIDSEYYVKENGHDEEL